MGRLGGGVSIIDARGRKSRQSEDAKLALERRLGVVSRTLTNQGKARYAPIVAITTPSFNQGRFLEETIQSVVSQEGDFSIDYVVVDGGSTDDSVAIIKKYESLLARGEWPVRCRGIHLRWCSEQDQGQSDAINKGFRMATGGIMAWLNSDDAYAPGALGTVSNAFAADAGCDVVYGKSAYIDESGTHLGAYPTENFDRDRLAVVNFIAQPSAFFRRSALERVGYPDASLRYVMDYDLWIRMSGSCHFRYLSEILSNYRLHGESKTVSPAHALANARECLEVVHKHFHWAPANRVYAYCAGWYESNVHLPFLKKKPVEVGITGPVALVKYLAMNRGIRLADAKQLSLRNLRGLVAGRKLY